MFGGLLEGNICVGLTRVQEGTQGNYTHGVGNGSGFDSTVMRKNSQILAPLYEVVSVVVVVKVHRCS